MCKLNLQQTWVDVNKQILSITQIDYSDFLECAENKYLENKLLIYMIKRKIRSQFALNVVGFIDEFQKNYCNQRKSLKKEKLEILLRIENVLNNSEILSSYSNIISIFIQSYMLFAIITNNRIYSWKNLLSIIKSLFMKSMRELQEQRLLLQFIIRFII